VIWAFRSTAWSIDKRSWARSRGSRDVSVVAGQVVDERVFLDKRMSVGQRRWQQESQR
jgi:hypothetical protein